MLPYVPESLGGKLLMEERITYGQQSELFKGVWALSDHDYKPVALKVIGLQRLTGSAAAQQVLKVRTYREWLVVSQQSD